MWWRHRICCKINATTILSPRYKHRTRYIHDYRHLVIESKVYDIAEQTPLDFASEFSSEMNNKILFKREDLQPIFSFKIRGAYNKIASLSPAEKDSGIVCCSAGNHAQGVALSANKLELNAKIVMPLATPEIKVNAVRQHGGKFAEIVLFGKNYDEAAAEAARLEKMEKRTMILPFDDPFVIAGQGTIGMEILQQAAHVDAIFVCCGGGGMLAGIAAWVKQIRPSVKIIGVEAADAAGMTASLDAGKVVSLNSVGLFADGAAVKTVGTETYRVCAENVDEMITVSTDEICAAIKTAFNDTRVILEPAGALAIAGVKAYVEANNVTNETFVATLSGANTDFARLRFISERADSSETLLSITIDESPGAFKRLLNTLSGYNVRVTEFSYRYSDAKKALIFLSFSTDTQEEKGALKAMKALQSASYDVLDLTHNELAIVHSRHLAGGKMISKKKEERCFRIEFRDRPGALLSLINKISQNDNNISLFHYRNHGADVGRVLVGFQGNECTLNKSLRDDYTIVEETSNEMYKQFL